ncbi:alkylhydroperoxidase [Alcanivorax sp. HI0083]|nr:MULTISPECIES: carboxymuconolactone decarboxylase family protein [unclassified Alcanivorax]KZY28476.1 alkylhydroperoxidase [Alcanivorax sp. HI0044]KZZ24277.1 alkylhydroperoxidase [Alcanivorax sp. HI0083]PHR64282.1 MAG: carboxymuconolactone decarboxylase family protein [Alcanivorax sp.]
MKARFNYYTASPDTMKAMFNTQAVIDATGLDKRLIALVELRASQINGCAFCMHMHAAQARKLGEDNARIDTVAGWRDTDWFSEREQAALGWTEYLTRLSQGGDGDAAYAALAEHFSEKERSDLSYVIGVINMWNRFSVGFQTHPE